jgi:esterase FrsA
MFVPGGRFRVILKDLFISACALTGQTERAANKLGVSFFLPALFRLRYANMGGLDPEVFAGQMNDLKSFEEGAWCGYWNDIAEKYEKEADDLLDGGGDEKQARDLLVKALTYYTVSAFPGTTPLRMEMYWKARELFERVNSMEEAQVKKVTLEIAGETVEGYEYFPPGRKRVPVAVMTNGLEGTVQEFCVPLRQFVDTGMGTFVMEMPGSYAYKKPMSEASEEIYKGVLDYVAAHPRVDPDNIMFLGFSFGGYWAARMPAVDKRISRAVVSGAPLDKAFSARGSLGMPEIITDVIMKITGANNPPEILPRLQALSFSRNDLYSKIECPMLVVNGDNDTLVGTEDSIILASKVPSAVLKLYADDDHCAMGHYELWLDFTRDWLLEGTGLKKR